MERPPKKHQDTKPKDEDIYLQKVLRHLAGPRNVKCYKIEKKEQIASILVELDPVRMYHITDRDFSHTVSRADEELQRLWLTVATLWWKEYNTSVDLEEIVKQLKDVGVEHIDYYRLILCNWLLEKTFRESIRFDLYFEGGLIAQLDIINNTKESKYFELVVPEDVYSSKMVEEYDKITENLPEFRKIKSFYKERTGMAKTQLSTFCFLYKILSVKGVWIDVNLEQTAQQRFKDPEELERYKNILEDYRTHMRKKDKEKKLIDLYDFPILDNLVLSCDRLIHKLQGGKRVTLQQREGVGQMDFLKLEDNYLEVRCNSKSTKFVERMLFSYFFENVEAEIVRTYEANILFNYRIPVPTFEQQLVIFYIILRNGYDDADWYPEDQKKYLIREKISK